VNNLRNGNRSPDQSNQICLFLAERSVVLGRKKAAYIYLTGTLNAAIWGAELAFGESRGRIYVVEATGPFEDDPNLTDKKYPGNPTLSYRSKDPLRVIGEVLNWQGHSAEELKAMKEGLERLKNLGVEAIED
jgi:hypothetical protein